MKRNKGVVTTEYKRKDQTLSLLEAATLLSKPAVVI